MADQTDFTQIAADFAANLKSQDRTDDGAAAEGDISADDNSAQEASMAIVLPAGVVGSESDPSVLDDIEAHDTTREAVDAESDGTGSQNAFDEDVDAKPATIELATNTNIFGSFPAAPFQRGEFQVPLCDLLIGDQSPSGVYDFDSGPGEALLHAVQTPETIAPLVVMKVNDDWHVLDGWARVTAMRFQFGNTANLLVRVIEWDGTHNAELYKRFAATFLTLKSRKIDKSILLRQFHLAWSVPQLVLAARIGWTESRVTRELAAAEAMIEAPRFAELHVKAGDPPIDYLYKVQQAREAAAKDDAAHPKRSPDKGATAKLEGKLESLLARPERFGTAEALAKLDIAKPTKPSASENDVGTSAALPDEPLEIIDCVEHPDGEPVAMIEMGRDQLPNIRLLVAAADLDDRRKAEVREVLRDAIDKLLG